MNTGFLGPTVATVLTVYGIETITINTYTILKSTELQQCLPFTVLKRIERYSETYRKTRCNSAYRLRY